MKAKLYTRMFQKAALTIFVFISPLYPIFSKPYSLADLEILVEGKNYKEFFKHAKDLPPTKRDNHWRDMVSTMAQSHVDELRSDNLYSRESFQFTEDLASWPEQRNDQFFQVKRNSFVLEYLKDCFTKSLTQKALSDQQYCKDDLLSFWRTSNKDPDIGHQLLLMHLGIFPLKHEERWPLVKAITKHKIGHFYCQKSSVYQEFIIHLKSEIFPDKAPELLKSWTIESLATNECFSKMKDQMKIQLFSGPIQNNKALFFVLNKMNELSSLEKSKWLILYYLSNPGTGPLLNQAWNALASLGQSFDKRILLLRELEKLDPLPGKLFDKAWSKSAKVFIRHLNDNFPEYIKTYASTCLNYLEGKGEFPHGNPTMECHALFKNLSKENLKTAEQVIIQPLQIRYSAIKKNTTVQ